MNLGILQRMNLSMYVLHDSPEDVESHLVEYNNSLPLVIALQNY